MLDLRFICENLEFVKQNISNKNEKADISEILNFDNRRREIIIEVERLKNLRNVVSKDIAELKKNKHDADKQIAEMKEVSDTIKSMDDEQREVEQKIREIQIRIPNVTHPSVPIGKTEDDNKIVYTWGEKKENPHAKNHIEIAKSLGIVDFERGAKVSGAGFHFYTGKGAKLERALINYMVDYHVEKHGYTELMPPFVVNENSMFGTGQLPKMAEDMYKSDADSMYFIPTAEVPVTNFHNGEMLKGEDLPIKYTAYSPCFRREAGGYGKEVRGLLRVHQFNKVEMVNFVKPEDSMNQLEIITSEAEDILKSLGLHYRRVLLCSGDTSFASAITMDLEIWTQGEAKWLEVSSCSCFTDFQARRANIRFKRDATAKPEFVHTLNGSGVATPRLMVAILENNVREDGHVTIPEPLRQFCGFDEI
ncbi:MAG: serine--tRNA ligase [bacterium]